MTFSVRVTGTATTQRNLRALAEKSPAGARRAVNRTIGVARIRVIRALSGLTGVPRGVLGGRRGSRSRGVAGRGYIKSVRATRRRSEGALVGLVEGVLFRRLRRRTLGRSQPAPGGAGKPFRQTVAGHDSLFERKSRRRLPIREVKIPLEPHASRAISTIMKRVSRSVYPAKIWEELKKVIKPVR